MQKYIAEMRLRVEVVGGRPCRLDIFIVIDIELQCQCPPEALCEGDHISHMNTIKHSSLIILLSTCNHCTYTHNILYILIKSHFSFGVISTSSRLWSEKTAGIDSHRATAIFLSYSKLYSYLFSNPSLNVHFHTFYGEFQGLIPNHYTRIDKLPGFDAWCLHT